MMESVLMRLQHGVEHLRRDRKFRREIAFCRFQKNCPISKKNVEFKKDFPISKKISDLETRCRFRKWLFSKKSPRF